VRRLAAGDALAVAITAAIHAGDGPAVASRLRADPTLPTARVVGGGGARSWLHVLADWPANRPNGAAMARALVEAGAEVGARFEGAHTETPLHWAASADDIAVLDVLVDAGADLEADGAVIGGGTALADAVAFGQWRAARRLVARGARTTLWQAAALGLEDRVSAALAEGPAASEITGALWCACHGGQRSAAEQLLAAGGDPGWVGWDGLTPAQAARRSGAAAIAAWLEGAAG
jgi:uncharacterized protein